MKWKIAFDEEMRQKRNAMATEEERRKTGRELFEQDASLATMDVQDRREILLQIFKYLVKIR